MCDMITVLNVFILRPHRPARRTDPLNAIHVMGNLLKTFVLSRTRTLVGEGKGRGKVDTGIVRPTSTPTGRSYKRLTDVIRLCRGRRSKGRTMTRCALWRRCGAVRC